MDERGDEQQGDEQGVAAPAPFPPGPTFEPAPPTQATAGTAATGATGAPAAFGTPAVALPPAPPAPPDAPASPPGKPPVWGALLAVPDDARAPRPLPTLTSMLAVGGGLLAAAGLFFLLAEVDGYDQRKVGLAISLVFLVLGVAISTINRSSRAAAAGVAISVLAVAPLVLYLWANADVFGSFSGDDLDGNPFDGIRGVYTLMFATAAVLWLAGYLLGPGRRYGVYLGAALLAIWMIPMLNIQITAIEDTFAPFQSSVTFDALPTDPGFDTFDDPSFDDPSFDDFDQISPDTTFEQPTISDPSTKLGVVSLAFGAAYLLFAGWRDRRGDPRMATAALVPALVILLQAVGYLGGHIGWFGWGVLAMAIGAAVLAVGLRGGRRASSWIGLVAATVGFGSLVVNALDESPRAIGGVLTVVGVVVALAVGVLGRDGDPAPAAPPSGDPTAPAAPLGAAVGSPSVPWAPPAAPATAPTPPTPPAGSPWAPPAPPPEAPGPQPF